MFALSFPGVDALNTIYCSILNQHLRSEGFAAVLQKSSSQLVKLALDFHHRITTTFLPTAIKFHYIFNLRDLSNIFQVQALCQLTTDWNKSLPLKNNLSQQHLLVALWMPVNRSFNWWKVIISPMCNVTFIWLNSEEWTRCRIGQTRLTHAFLHKSEDPTLCMFCKTPLSIKLILLDHPGFCAIESSFLKLVNLRTYLVRFCLNFYHILILKNLIKYYLLCLFVCLVLLYLYDICNWVFAMKIVSDAFKCFTVKWHLDCSAGLQNNEAADSVECL